MNSKLKYEVFIFNICSKILSMRKNKFNLVRLYEIMIN